MTAPRPAAPPSRPPAVLIGVDAGGSHTDAAAADATLNVLARVRGGAAALESGSIDSAAGTIAETVRRALTAAGAEGAAILVVGAAGAGRDEVRTALEDHLASLGLAPRIRVTTDAAIALQNAFGDGPGIVLVAGTGSIAYARDLAGTVRRAGGRGWRFGDEGSGYALARAGISAVAKASDKRAPPTALTGALTKAAGVSPAELFGWADAAHRGTIANLARVVQAVAREGDGAAAGLVREAANDLADHVAALLEMIPGRAPIDLALAGGLLTAGSPVREALVAIVQERVPRARVRDAPVDPPLGALSLAARMMTS